jgi:cobalt/nickel transport system permease protein
VNSDISDLLKKDMPAWMFDKNPPGGTLDKSSSMGFLRKALVGISKVILNEIYSEKYVWNKKFLQKIDPRLKLLTVLFFMVFCGLAKNILTLILLTFVVIMYTKLSGLNMKHYFKRVWLVLPLLVFVLSVPAATNIFIKGKPLLYIYKGQDFKLLFAGFPKDLYFSGNGIITILKMSFRIGVSISFGYLLVMTTRWIHLTKSLSVLKIPSLVIAILGMTYRYIFVISKIAFEMFEAGYLRTVGRLKNKDSRRFIANRISFLFVKSSFLSDEIYDSMRCRGYLGETVYLNSFKLSRVDLLWTVNNIIIVCILVMGEILF